MAEKQTARPGSNRNETIHYIYSFVCITVLISCFATHLITGRPALVRFDSLAGATLLGLAFAGYAAWLIWDQASGTGITMAQALKEHLKGSALQCILLYWLILILVPALINLF